MSTRPTFTPGRAAISGALGALAVAAVVIWVLRDSMLRFVDGGAAPPPPPAAMAGMAGMDMSAGGEVMLTAEAIRTFGITFESAERRPLDDVVRTVGVVAPDETRVVSVTARFDGYVERLRADFTGRSVRAGEPLVEIFSPELLAAQEELLLAASTDRQAVTGQTSAPLDLTGAARQRLLRLGLSPQQIDGILARQSASRTLTLDAPMTGVVVEKNVVSGQAVEAGQSLFTIADLRTLWLEVQVRGLDAALVGQGDSVSVEIESLGGPPISGRIDYVYPSLEADARSLKARVPLANPDGRLRPGAYATVRIHVGGRTALTVPTSAVVNTGDRRIVFVDLGGGRLVPQDVEIGRTSGEFTEVVSGVEPGQQVVTSAQFLLDSESNLAEVMRSMIGQMSTADMGSRDTPGMSGMDMTGQGR